MDGPTEWLTHLLSENVELKRQVRLMRENLELRRFLEEGSNEIHARDCPHIKGHVYPEPCSPVGQNVEESYSTLCQHILESLDKMIPLRRVKDNPLKANPWFSSDLFQQRLRCKQAERVWRRHYLEADKLLYKKSLQDYKAQIRVAKVKFLEDTLATAALRCLNYSPIQRRRLSKFLEGQESSTSPSLQILLSSNHGANCRENGLQNLRCVPQTVVGSGLFSLHSPDQILSQGSGESGDGSTEKPLSDTEEKCKAKRVWFSDPCLPLVGQNMSTPIYFLSDLRGSHGGKEGRVIGEIAFQLDRRILFHVFPGSTRLYGFTVSNIIDKIMQCSRKPLDGSLDEEKQKEMSQRYLSLMCQLQKLGYHRDVHPIFSEFLINAYGILKQRDLRGNPIYSNQVSLRKMVISIMPAKFLRDTLLLLNCLCEMSKDDGKPLFAW
ncbi:speriolin-like protein [Lissotriton helveticus]